MVGFCAAFLLTIADRETDEMALLDDSRKVGTGAIRVVSNVSIQD